MLTEQWFSSACPGLLWVTSMSTEASIWLGGVGGEQS